MSEHNNKDHLFQKISTALKSAADLFFPQSCFGCGRFPGNNQPSKPHSPWLCPRCQSRIPLLHIQNCFQCAQNTTRYGETCFQCDSHHPLDAVFSAICYQVPVIKRMIHAYKYQFVESLHIPLGKILAHSVEKSALPLPHLLIPVPLHPKRLRYRGFNQSALLANILTQEVAALSDTPVSAALIRSRFTKPQQKTRSKNERATNLSNAFQVHPDAELKNKIIWLIDDVATTKSTLTECAQVLKEAGAKKVYAVVLAQD